MTSPSVLNTDNDQWEWYCPITCSWRTVVFDTFRYMGPLEEGRWGHKREWGDRIYSVADGTLRRRPPEKDKWECNWYILRGFVHASWNGSPSPEHPENIKADEHGYTYTSKYNETVSTYSDPPTLRRKVILNLADPEPGPEVSSLTSESKMRDNNRWEIDISEVYGPGAWKELSLSHAQRVSQNQWLGNVTGRIYSVADGTLRRRCPKKDKWEMTAPSNLKSGGDQRPYKDQGWVELNPERIRVVEKGYEHMDLPDVFNTYRNPPTLRRFTADSDPFPAFGATQVAKEIIEKMKSDEPEPSNEPEPLKSEVVGGPVPALPDWAVSKESHIALRYNVVDNTDLKHGDRVWCKVTGAGPMVVIGPNQSRPGYLTLSLGYTTQQTDLTNGLDGKRQKVHTKFAFLPPGCLTTEDPEAEQKAEDQEAIEAARRVSYNRWLTVHVTLAILWWAGWVAAAWCFSG